MANKATTLTVTPASLDGTFDMELAYGDELTVTISGASSYAYATLVLTITDMDGNDMAVCSSFSASYVGTLSLHTTELQEFFEDLSANARRAFRVYLSDTSGEALIVHDIVRIRNNPVVDGAGSATPAATTIADIQAKLGKIEDATDPDIWHKLTANMALGGTIEVGAGEDMS